jgi:hypothetical protein
MDPARNEFLTVSRYLREPLQAVVLVTDVCDLIARYLFIRIEKINEKEPQSGFNAFSIRPPLTELYSRQMHIHIKQYGAQIFFKTKNHTWAINLDIGFHAWHVDDCRQSEDQLMIIKNKKTLYDEPYPGQDKIITVDLIYNECQTLLQIFISPLNTSVLSQKYPQLTTPHLKFEIDKPSELVDIQGIALNHDYDPHSDSFAPRIFYPSFS